MTRSFPATPPARRLSRPAMAGHLEPSRAALNNTDRHPPSGFGILLEVDNDCIVGAVRVEHSPVLRPEAAIEVKVGNTTRRGLSLVEAYGPGPASSGNLRRGADLFAVDWAATNFVVDAISEKVATAADERGEGVWHPRLGCRVIKVHYHWPRRAGELFMSGGSCCDWSEALRFFQSIDPEVEAVESYAAGQPDVRYVRQDGEWQLSLPAFNQ